MPGPGENTAGVVTGCPAIVHPERAGQRSAAAIATARMGHLLKATPFISGPASIWFRRQAANTRAGARPGRETIEGLIVHDSATADLWMRVTQRKPGEGQPHDPETGRMLPNVDNVNERTERPTGISEQAGLRRLRKAAEAGGRF